METLPPDLILQIASYLSLIDLQRYGTVLNLFRKYRGLHRQGLYHRLYRRQLVDFLFERLNLGPMEIPELLQTELKIVETLDTTPHQRISTQITRIVMDRDNGYRIRIYLDATVTSHIRFLYVGRTEIRMFIFRLVKMRGLTPWLPLISPNNHQN